MKKVLDIAEGSTAQTKNQRPRIKALKIRKANTLPVQSDIAMFSKDDDLMFLKDSKPKNITDKNLTAQDDTLWIADKNQIENSVVSGIEQQNIQSIPVVSLSNSTSNISILSEDTTAFVVTFDEPQNIGGAVATLNRPKLTSSQRLKTQQIITTTAQRVPTKPLAKLQTVASSTLNRDNTNGAGGAQRTNPKDRTGTNKEEKTKAGRVLNTTKATNFRPTRPALPARTMSAPTVSPSKTANIKKKSAPVSSHRPPLVKESKVKLNPIPKPLKVTATVTTESTTVSVSISASSTPSHKMQIVPTTTNLFNRTKNRYYTPYDKAAIGFATRKFKNRPLPDSSELKAKLNSYAAKIIEELTGQSGDFNEKTGDNTTVELVPKLEEQIFETSAKRSRVSIKQALPATQIITPLPSEPSPPLSFVDPVKFLEDVREAEKENGVIENIKN